MLDKTTELEYSQFRDQFDLLSEQESQGLGDRLTKQQIYLARISGISRLQTALFLINTLSTKLNELDKQVNG